MKTVKESSAGACWCWTSERNRIDSVVHGKPVVHSKDCPIAKAIKEAPCAQP